MTYNSIKFNYQMNQIRKKKKIWITEYFKILFYYFYMYNILS